MKYLKIIFYWLYPTNINKKLRIRGGWKLTSENKKVCTPKLIETAEWNVKMYINEMWKNIAEGVKRVSNEVIVGESRGNSMPELKQTW